MPRPKSTVNWLVYGLPAARAEYRFHPSRLWRFDYAWPEYKIAVEQEGGIWIKGRAGRGGAHSAPLGILRDMEKNNEAVKLGWKVFRFTPRELQKGIAASFLTDVFRGVR